MKNYLVHFIICFTSSIYAQNLAYKVPGNTAFAMSFNGKNLSDKVAIKTIQEYPWMQTLLEKELKFMPKDLSQTGKNGTIVTESCYTIKGDHTNSLQYFFDVLNEFYTESKKEIIVPQ